MREKLESALDAVLGHDVSVDAVGLNVGEACVEHLNQLGVVALQHGKAIGTDIDLFADGLQIQILCSDLIVDNREVFKTGSIVAVDDSGVDGGGILVGDDVKPYSSAMLSAYVSLMVPVLAATVLPARSSTEAMSLSPLTIMIWPSSK